MEASGYNFTHRYTPEVVESIFYWILSEIEKAGYLTPETVFIDGTHIKANANMKKAIKKAVPKAAKIYEEQLMKEVNEDREKNRKKPFDDNDKNKGSKAEEEKKCLNPQLIRKAEFSTKESTRSVLHTQHRQLVTKSDM